MTQDEFELFCDELASHTYKPGWSFDPTMEEETGVVMVTVTMCQVNANVPCEFVIGPLSLDDFEMAANGTTDEVDARQAYVQFRFFRYRERVPEWETFENTPKTVTTWLQDLITRMEEHERDEWFKLNGVHVANPHPELIKL